MPVNCWQRQGNAGVPWRLYLAPGVLACAGKQSMPLIQGKEWRRSIDSDRHDCRISAHAYFPRPVDIAGVLSLHTPFEIGGIMMVGHMLRSRMGICMVMLGCTLASCGSKNDAAEKDGAAAPGASTTQSPSTSTTPEGGGSSGPVEGIDACAMLTVDEVSTITGIKMNSSGSENNSCSYAPGEAA